MVNNLRAVPGQEHLLPHSQHVNGFQNYRDFTAGVGLEEDQSPVFISITWCFC